MLNVVTKKEDCRLSLFISTFFVISVLNATTKTVFPIPLSLWVIISLICGGVFMWMGLRTFNIIMNKNLNIYIWISLMFIFLYSISLIRNQDCILQILNYALWTFLFCIPLGLATFTIIDYEILYRKLLKYSYLITGLLSCSVFFSYVDNTYNMFFSSSLILPLLLHLNEYLAERRRWFFLLSCYEFILILLYGSRGALLCLCVFVGFYFLLRMKSIKMKSALIVIIIGFFVIFYNFKNQIGNQLLFFFDSHGYYSRTLIMLFSDEISNLSSRDFIWDYCYEMITEKPIFGWGIGGELTKLSNYFDNTDGVTTPHNGFLELMLHHGLIIGILIGLFFVLSIFRIIWVQNTFLKSLMLIFYAAFMTITMTVGDGYLVKPGVWIYLFLFFASFKKNTQVPL